MCSLPLFCFSLGEQRERRRCNPNGWAARARLPRHGEGAAGCDGGLETVGNWRGGRWRRRGSDEVGSRRRLIDPMRRSSSLLGGLLQKRRRLVDTLVGEWAGVHKAAALRWGHRRSPLTMKTTTSGAGRPGGGGGTRRSGGGGRRTRASRSPPPPPPPQASAGHGRRKAAASRGGRGRRPL